MIYSSHLMKNVLTPFRVMLKSLEASNSQDDFCIWLLHSANEDANPIKVIVPCKFSCHDSIAYDEMCMAERKAEKETVKMVSFTAVIRRKEPQHKFLMSGTVPDREQAAYFLTILPVALL